MNMHELLTSHVHCKLIGLIELMTLMMTIATIIMMMVMMVMMMLSLLDNYINIFIPPLLAVNYCFVLGLLIHL